MKTLTLELTVTEADLLCDVVANAGPLLLESPVAEMARMVAAKKIARALHEHVHAFLDKMLYFQREVREAQGRSVAVEIGARA